jgi:3-deoxy-D-manno-octulosonate 8-phosphate phosphatase (KDO 8-P phosphatase)
MKNKFDNIKAVVFDVDGVLTDGKIILDHKGREIKAFNVKDGQLIQFMKRNGIIFGAISGRTSAALEHRLNHLKIEFIRLKADNKVVCIQEFIQQFKLSAESICYIGDDIIDIGVMKLCGLAVAPADASQFVIPYADMITRAKGGEGVLREVLDAIVMERGMVEDLISK